MGRRVTVLKKQILFDCTFIFILVFGIQYLFLEGLPFFWEDDIYLIKNAETISWAALIKDILDPFSTSWSPWYRPIRILYIKLALSWGGYDPNLYHLIQIFITALSIIIIFMVISFIAKNRLFASGGAFSYVLLPPVSIATGFIADPGNLVVFLVATAIYSFVLIERCRNNYFLFYSLQGGLLLLTLFAIKTRVNGCLIPFIISSYLFIVHPKRSLKFLPLMAGMFSLLIPLLWYKGKIEIYFHFKKLTQDLGNVFYIVSPFFLIFCLTILLLYFLWKSLKIRNSKNVKFKKLKKSLEGYFSDMTEERESLFKITLLWLAFEIPFLILFPSKEIRYLVHITFPLTILIYSTLPLFLHRKNIQSNFFRFIFLSIFLFHLYINFQWNWQFRGSLGSYFLANNELMTFMDKKCKQCFIIHNSIGKPFFSLRTNNRYVYISESEERPKAYLDIKNVKLQFEERPPFKHIYVIHDGIIIPKTINTLSFVGKKNTFYDRLQSWSKLKIKWVSHHLHPFSEFQEVTWPHETLMTRIKLSNTVE